jgi:hypothetical protein
MITSLYSFEKIVREHQREMLEAAHTAHLIHQARANQERKGHGLARLLIKVGVWITSFNRRYMTDEKAHDI